MILKSKSGISLLIFALVLSMLLANPSLARVEKDEEEKCFTEAVDISEGELNNLNNKSYDDVVTIKSIEIGGNSLVSTDRILKTIHLKPGEKFDRKHVQKCLRKIYGMGFFTDRIKAVPRSEESGITLHIQVEENVPVTGFNIVGNEVVPSEEIYILLSDQAGLPQNINLLNKSIKDIENYYAEKGYVLARVKRISDDPDGAINIEINEGIIEEVAIAGNTKTKDYVIKRHITVQPGEVYNEKKLKGDLVRIFGTQAFGDVRRVISVSPKNPEKYKLTIEVDEKRTGSISFGGGVDTETGLFGSLGYTDNNFRGRGQELSVNGIIGSGRIFDDVDVVSRSPIQFEANFVEPRFRQTLNSVQVNAFGRDLASFQVPLAVERKIGGQIEVTRPLRSISNKLAGGIALGFEDVKMKEGNLEEINSRYSSKNFSKAETERLRNKQLEDGSFLTISPSLVYDSRNSIINPRDGVYASVNFRESFAIFGDAETFGKITGTVRKFVPVGNRSTFTFGGKIGSKALGDLPEFAAFRLGGPYSVRGFKEGNVGNGESFILATAEFRTPVPYLDRLKYKFLKNIKMAFFADAGQVFDETITNTIYDRPGHAISIGSGLIVPIPVLGPIRFDYGVPITSGDNKGRFTFGIGERY